jgi:hypothetical protein
MPAPQKAVDQQDIWKDAQMRHFAVALISHALARLNAGNIHFTTDCVPDEERAIGGVHIGNGVPGSIITKLKNAHVIRAVGVFVNGKFYADSEKSHRGDAKTRPVDKYELCSRASAQEFLLRNKIDPRQPQQELFAAPSTAAVAFA